MDSERSRKPRLDNDRLYAGFYVYDDVEFRLMVKRSKRISNMERA